MCLLVLLALQAGLRGAPTMASGFGDDQFGQSPMDTRRLKSVPAACDISEPSTSIKQCEIGDASKSVVIGAGAPNANCQGRVSLSTKGMPSIAVGNITINAGGTLELHDKFFDSGITHAELTTTGIDVKGGSLLIGDAVCPIGTINHAAKVTIRFVGEKPTTCGDLTQPTATCPGYVKGIQVEPPAIGGSGGTVRMYGLKGVPPEGVDWTYLSQPAGHLVEFSKKNGVMKPPLKHKDIIYTAARVDTGTGAWRPDDWIAVATTSFSPWETEFVQIESVEQDKDNMNATGSRIKLKEPGLTYYHFGGPDPGDPTTNANYTAGAATNYGVDERAEVGLISRNIILTSDSDEPKSSKHWGGELKFLKGFQALSLQGVEIQKFGKEQLGSYPIHFHMDGPLSGYAAADVLVDSDSIDHSYNKCITIHSTQDVTFSNNVCARITGHIFYQEVGNETNVAFKNNLGMGAMSNSFDVNTTGKNSETRHKVIEKYYWVGDHMFEPPIPRSAGMRVFDQFNIFDTDNQNNPQGGTGTSSPIPFITTRGQCGKIDATGKVNLTGVPDNDKPITCYPGNPNKDKVLYFEAPSGFWLLNPSAKLTGNSIAGCQDTGAAYWYVPPPDPNLNAVKFIPIGPTYPDPHGVFQNNRAHGCYRGLIDDQFELGSADQLSGYQNAEKNATNHPLVDEFDSFTVSRIRDRGIWLRPVFFLVKDARMATNKHAISFVTSGGADGNYPGVWSLLSHSTMVGISTNNVDRFGPCGSKVLIGGAQVRGGSFGCIDQTVPADGIATGGEFTEHGYSSPDLNMFGFMSYDGPPLIVKDRFVNYLIDPTDPKNTLLTDVDKKVLKTWIFTSPYTHYEGDAAIGWLENNQSAYPTASSAEELSFDNVDFRHQAFTDKVNLGNFDDGDKNTAVLDLDGTLSGYAVGDASGNPIAGAFPISLNNLEFNASSNSVDECKATGQQNTDLEGRPTAAMVPSGIGQLEFESLYPNNPKPFPQPPGGDHTQFLTFYKDTLDFNQHGSMQLHSRNGLGVWEPKVTSGYGYVVRADPFTLQGVKSGVGIPPLVDVSLVDTVKPNISSAPFYVQIGICYSGEDGSHPADNFTVTHGYRSWGGGSFEPGDQTLRKYFNQLITLSDAKQWCHNLDYQQANNLPGNPGGFTGCPADGVALNSGTCPAGTTPITDQQGKMSCLFPKNTPALTESTTGIAGMTTDGTLNGPPDLTKYFYDTTTGMLYLWIAQTDANAVGPSPLGNCAGTSNDPPFCPQNADGISTGESYYNCPAQGCPTYRITLSDPNYKPGKSTCPVFGSTGDANGWATGTGGNTWPGPPANQPTLVYFGTKNLVARTTPVPAPLPHYAAATDPTCSITQP